jgi:hypothetical protein
MDGNNWLARMGTCALERGCSGAVLHVNPAPSGKRVFGTRCSLAAKRPQQTA